MQEKPIYREVLDSLEEDERGLPYNLVYMPVLIEYVSWVLEEAYKSGKSRLYFLARDGYQMYLVAQKLCELKRLPLSCRYLHVSRYAMRVPEYHLMGEDCVEHICVGGIDVTVGRIMKRAGLESSEARKFLPEYNANRILNYNEVMSIKERLRQSKEFLNQVYEVSRAAYEPAIGYLRQEGLFEDVSYALVDSGWVGTLQRTIARLVEKPTLEGYYFGLYEIPQGMSKIQYHGYYFTPKSNIRRKVHFSNCLFEAIFTATEGMTIRYEKRDEHFVPVKDFASGPNALAVTLNCVCLEKYMEAYIRLAQQQPFSFKSTRFVQKLLCKAMGNPTEWEVEVFGDLLFSDDVLEGNLKKVAAELSTEEIHMQRFVSKALIMLGLKKGVLHESAWIEGSIRRNGVQVRRNLFHAKLYKYFVYLRKLMK